MLKPSLMPQKIPNAPFFVDLEVIRLTANGIWKSDEVEIDHEQTVRIFAKSLKRDAQGYYLQIAHETKRIVVEDTAYFVIGIEGNSADGYDLRLNDESRERLDPMTLTYRPGRLTCRIQGASAGKGEEAKFLHAAYFDLLKELEEDSASYWIEIQGRRVTLATK